MKENKEKKFKQKRKLWYRNLKFLMRMRYHRPKFVYLNEHPSNGAIIISNHEGTDAPMSLEMYADFPVRMWGTYKMNSGLKMMYKYQSEVYYHQKKHWNLFGAKMFCLIASPMTNLFYKGLNLISTYEDARFRKTIRESEDALINKKENLVIFPEKSNNGYVDVLEGFYAGFVVLAQSLYKKGYDAPITVSYYKKKENTYIFGETFKYSELLEKYKNKNDIANFLLEKCNELGKTDLNKIEVTNK